MNPQIIAHRGFWQNNILLQNTIEALVAAAALPVYGSECDVRLTADEVLVLHHDPDISGLEIAKNTFEDLQVQSQKLGGVLDKFEDYLERSKAFPNLKLIVEVKDLDTKEAEEALVQSTLQAIAKAGILSRVEFLSFSLHICKRLKELASDHPVFYLNGDLPPAQILEEGLDGIDYEDVVFRQHPEWIAECRELGLLTNCWTVDHEEDFNWLRDLNIDFITTNRPAFFSKINA